MKEKLIRKRALLIGLSALSLTISGCQEKEETISLPKVLEVKEEPKPEKTISLAEIEENSKKEELKEITISAIGDCTLGSDPNFGYERTFTQVLDEQNHDYSYFFEGVNDVLSKDDLTIANLETTFTNSNERVDKKFNFKGDYDYVNILKEGSIEAVNLANNHTYDYGKSGYIDTINTLVNENIPYFGYENYSIVNVDGIEIGLAGLTGWNEADAKANTEKAIQYFKEQETDLIIMTYHWGTEREYYQNNTQQNIGRYAIDLGADLVLGHHPHVLQGIENYNGKYIVYSLGNFVFGGNKNPSDKDTMIFQETFSFQENKLIDTNIEIIPCSLSSRSDLNDYQPKILEGEEQKRVLKKVLDASENLD